MIGYVERPGNTRTPPLVPQRGIPTPSRTRLSHSHTRSRSMGRGICNVFTPMKREGFTLIELVIVVAIIGLLAMIAVPRLTNLKDRAQVTAMKTDLRNLVTLEESYFAQNTKYTTDLGSSYRVSAGNTPPVITLTGDGWTATTSSPTTGETCAVFVGSTPVPPATKEGAPACAKSGTATVTP